MDAATTRFPSKYALFLTAALLAAPVAAQAQLQVSSNSVTLGQSAQVNVSSTGSQIAFSISANYGTVAPSGWFSVSASSNTTPATLGILIVNALPSLGPYSGSITLKDNANSADTATITVNYVPNGGTGNGTLTATPNPVTMTTTPNNGAQTSAGVSLTSTSATTITGTLSFSPSSPYITISSGTFAVTSGSPFNFSVIGAAGTPAGTYQATIQVQPSNGVAAAITIPVTYTSGSGTGTNVSPSSFTLNYPNGPLSQAVTVTTTANASYFQATANAAWLLVGGSSGSCSGTSTFGSPNTQFAVCLNSSTVTSYPSGSQGTVTVTGSDGSQATVTVTLSINGVGSAVTITPSSVSFSNIPVGTTALQAQTVELQTASSGVSFFANPTTSTGTNWLSLSQYSGTLTGGNVQNGLTIYASPSGLSQGTYQGTVNLTYSGAISGSAQIQVTLGIGTGTGCNGCGTGGLAAPSALTFYYQVNGGSQQGLSSSILVNSSGTWSSSVTYNTTNQHWLSVTPTGSTPQQILVQAIPTGLATGTYSANINVTTTGGTAVIPVNLTVTNSMVATTAPGAILIPAYNVGDPTPFSTVYVYASDGSAQTVTATPSASWIQLNTTSSTTTAAFGVTLNPSVLPNGLNTGSITFSVANAADTTWVLPIAVVVSGSTSTGSGPLAFSSNSLAFNSVVGGTAPNQTLTVTSSAASNFSVSATSSGWLSVTPSFVTLSGGSGQVTVSVNPAGLANNAYYGTLNFVANGITQTVQVVLSVGSGNNTSGLNASPSSLSFSYQVGGAVPGAQGIGVTAANGGNTIFTASASTSTGGNWLSLNIGSSTQEFTPFSGLTASVTPTGLSSGTYNGSIVLTTTAGTLTVPVSLTVSGAPAISATPTNMTFNFTAGGTVPGSQTVTVSGTGSFTATASSNASWLSVTPTSGTAPGSVTVSVSPNNLTAGTYSGTVVVAGTGGSTGSTTVNVTLVVTAPLPTITSIGNAGSYATGAISPGEVITIFGTALGPSAPVQLTLTANGKVSTNLGNVQVLVNGIASPLIYVSSTQVSAVVPYEVAIFQTAQVYVTFLGQSSNAMQVGVATTAPGLFTANASGTGPGAILNQNLSVNSPSNPAAKGSVIAIYLTGEGQTSPQGVTGSVTQALAAPPYTPQPLLPVAVLINGSPAAIQFAGEAPGLVAGVMQINVTIPSGTPSGAQSLLVSIGGRNSQNGVTVSVQ